MAAAAPLAVVEAVTARVSVLPVVGSDLPTGLSAVVGVTKQLEVDLGDTLDEVGHGAGQSCVRMVPAGRLPDLREVRDIMFSWIRPVAVLTSQFFLSDEKGEMDMPSRINDGRASLQQEVDFDSVHRCPQKMGQATGTHRLAKLSPPERATISVDTVSSNGPCDLDRKYKLKLCVMMVQSRVHTPITGLEISTYPRLKTNDGKSN